ncbi:MAG TPA: serine/threonine-protein kinase [Polyangia bacterium]|nr:serine/threonine-protein kinase [Polyangia bacterium]
MPQLSRQELLRKHSAVFAARPAPVSAGLPSAWLPGTEFSRYQIDSRLAAGGMAEVWQARIKGARGFEKRIVIKTMHTALQGQPELVQMFVGEASIAAQLNHPNIVQVLDFGRLEGRYFIAMEYVPGVTLRVAHKRAIAGGGRLPVAAVLHVMMDVCDAMDHLHAASDRHGALGLVHRDISPDNIIISTGGMAKLIDFGAARATARTASTPVFIGKYRYAAPERIRRDGEDCRSDVYSAGVILYECLAGKRPFDGTDSEVIAGSLASHACDPRVRAPGVPARLAEVVIKATAQNPAERFATAGDMRTALAACLGEAQGWSRLRDVTAALQDLSLDPAMSADEKEAVPEPIAEPGYDDYAVFEQGARALCEVAIADVPRPYSRPAPLPPPLPVRSAIPPSLARPLAVRTTATERTARGPDRGRSPR